MIRTRYWLRPPVVLARLVAFVGVFAALTVTGAQAHPHVWATIRTELLYAPDGSVTGVRHTWTFDDGYSAFATMGIHAETKGQFTREELQPLAKLNVDSLKDYAYFTYAKYDGTRLKDAFNNPIDYWLDYDPKAAELTLHFTLPFKKPVLAKSLTIEVYDPEFFIDFGFAETDPVQLVGAPPQCTVSTAKPYDANFLTSQSLNRSFIPSEANIGLGMDFANRILVKCP